MKRKVFSTFFSVISAFWKNKDLSEGIALKLLLFNAKIRLTYCFGLFFRVNISSIGASCKELEKLIDHKAECLNTNRLLETVPGKLHSYPCHALELFGLCYLAQTKSFPEAL